MKGKLGFACDYMKGAHPSVMEKMMETNMMETIGYGRDEVTEEARDLVRKACDCPKALVEFLIGGTQTNAVMIDAFLRSYQGVIAADTGHISIHEAGAIEASGHKVITLPHSEGKITARQVKEYLENYYNDDSYEHMVIPGMIYLSQPTEYGTLYSLEELKGFRQVCDEYDIPLYIDGARLAYALGCPDNDVTLKDLACVCDAFYIGGTKCGLLFGEAVVIPDPEAIPHLFTTIKQHGALLAKGRLLGVQFAELFRNGLYYEIGKHAMEAAERIKNALKEKGYRFKIDSPTNQIFCIMDNEALKGFGERVEYTFWEKYDDTHTVIRLATDWGTTDEEVDALIDVL